MISSPRPVQLMSFPHGSRTHNRENTLCFPGGVHGILYVVLGLFLFSFLISKSPIMAEALTLLGVEASGSQPRGKRSWKTEVAVTFRKAKHTRCFLSLENFVSLILVTSKAS